MKKQITFNINQEEISVNVDFALIELIERGFDANADMIATVILPQMQTVKITKLASVVADVLATSKTEQTRTEIKEYVLGAGPNEIAKFGVSLMIACLLLRRHIDEEGFDRIKTAQNDLEKEPKADDVKKLAPRVVSSRNRSLRSTTKSRSVPGK